MAYFDENLLEPITAISYFGEPSVWNDLKRDIMKAAVLGT